jgi:hypothetical protein
MTAALDDLRRGVDAALADFQSKTDEIIEHLDTDDAYMWEEGNKQLDVDGLVGLRTRPCGRWPACPPSTRSCLRPACRRAASSTSRRSRGR